MNEPGRGRGSASHRDSASRWLVTIVILVAVVSACAGNPSSTNESVPPTGEPAESDASTPTPRLPSPGPASPTPSPSTPTATPTAPSPTPGPAKWRLVWSDEFDGPAGTPPDRAAWLYEIGGGGWGNQERQFYTDYPENVALDGNGSLLITARSSDGSLACHYGPCEYTSGRLTTKGRHEFKYGRVEARIKVPPGVGTWPAFWMLGTDIGTVGWPASGEIDVMEYVGRWPNWILGTIHGPGYYGTSGPSKIADLGKPVADDFHTYAIEWRSGHIAWFFDGDLYFEVRPDVVAPREWAFDHPFYLLLNLAIGGTFGGPVPAETTFPQTMAVDYVRVFEEEPQ